MKECFGTKTNSVERYMLHALLTVLDFRVYQIITVKSNLTWLTNKELTERLKYLNFRIVIEEKTKDAFTHKRNVELVPSPRSSLEKPSKKKSSDRISSRHKSYKKFFF